MQELGTVWFPNLCYSSATFPFPQKHLQPLWSTTLLRWAQTMLPLHLMAQTFLQRFRSLSIKKLCYDKKRPSQICRQFAYSCTSVHYFHKFNSNGKIASIRSHLREILRLLWQVTGKRWPFQWTADNSLQGKKLDLLHAVIHYIVICLKQTKN